MNIVIVGIGDNQWDCYVIVDSMVYQQMVILENYVNLAVQKWNFMVFQMCDVMVVKLDFFGVGLFNFIDQFQEGIFFCVGMIGQKCYFIWLYMECNVLQCLFFIEISFVDMFKVNYC